MVPTRLPSAGEPRKIRSSLAVRAVVQDYGAIAGRADLPLNIPWEGVLIIEQQTMDDLLGGAARGENDSMDEYIPKGCLAS